MKKMIISCWLLIVGLTVTGCATTTTVVKGGAPSPGEEAYKYVLIKSESPFYIYFSIGTQKVLLEPGAEITTIRTRPLGWLSPSFGRFSFIAYAYRVKHSNGSLDEFVGQRQFWIYLDGYPHIYNGRVYGDIIIMDYFPVSSFGYPDRWQGSFARFIPWRAEFRHY